MSFIGIGISFCDARVYTETIVIFSLYNLLIIAILNVNLYLHKFIINTNYIRDITERNIINFMQHACFLIITYKNPLHATADDTILNLH